VVLDYIINNYTILNISNIKTAWLHSTHTIKPVFDEYNRKNIRINMNMTEHLRYEQEENHEYSRWLQSQCKSPS